MSAEEDFKAGIDELFVEFGVTASVSRTGAQTMNKVTGRLEGTSTVQPFNVEAILGRRSVKQDNGAQEWIQTIRTKQELENGDRVTLGARTVRVLRVVPSSFKLSVLSYLSDVEDC